MPASDNYSLLFDLYNALVRYVSRFLVQRQLLAIAGVLFVAWVLSLLLVEWGKRRYLQWYGRQRRTLRNTQGRHWRFHLVRAAAIVLQQTMFPIVAIALLSATELLFAQMGWLSGLLKWAESLVAVFAGYRLLIALLYIFVRRRTANRFHRRLFGPLMFVAILLLIISKLVNLDRLAKVILFPMFDNPVTIGALFLATVGLYFWIDATYGVQEVLKRLIVSRTHAHEGRVEATLTVLRYILIGLGVYWAMSILGFDPTTVAAITGGLSIGIGFALQDVLKNFFGGLVLLFEGTVRPGDYVEVGGKEAVVQKLSIRSTLVRTGDNVEIIVPNQEWLVRSVVTYTGSSRSMRLRFPLTVKRSVEVGQVFQLLSDTVRRHPLVMDDPGPSVSIVNFNANNVDYLLTVWVKDAADMGKVNSDLRLMLLNALETADIPLA